MTIISDSLSLFAPPIDMKVSEFADKYRQLSRESSAEAGRWDTSRAEYQREIMDVCCDPEIETVVWMSSSQVGKSECENNIIAHYISNNPCPILMVQPTVDMAESYSKDRIAPMIRDTPILNKSVSDSKSRNSESTILHKKFIGGHFTLIGSNAPSQLASRPIKVVLFDEVDRYKPNIEGDVVKLASKRTTTFWDRKIIMVSTPTIKGASRIEMAYEESDKRRYFVPCHSCGHEQHLIFGNVKWEKDNPSTALYYCEKCGQGWSDTQRWNAVKKGHWVAEREVKGIAGFHLNEIYSPWVSLNDMVTNFLEAKKSKETLKTFVNTSLGETWEEEGIQLDDNELLARREEYDKVPSDALVLVAAVDVQDDRLEIEVKGFGVGEESWGVDYKIIYGDPSKAIVWKDLDTALLQTYENEDGYTMRIACTCIDSGGHFTNEVYKFTKNKESRRVYAVKGSSASGAPLVNRGTRSNKANVKLFAVGTDTAKELIFARLKIDDFGAGYMHFTRKLHDEEYFKQLTAEKITTKFLRGFPSRVWTKTRARNEALDLNVYALAALAILNPNWNALQANVIKKQEIQEDTPPQIPIPQRIKPVRQKGSWVTRY